MSDEQKSMQDLDEELKAVELKFQAFDDEVSEL